MSHQALARKWRPRNFSEIVGQEHIVRALIHALEYGRMHHAYLFTGTRGVGKTTIARILAKALNCDHRNTYNPCGECLICREVDEGRFVDLIEVDAASRTKVEDTRDLLENVQYAPNQGRYKIYLIDEVHMLSGHSFNALLKTLEEPPPHVKFLLATTDPQKIPVTILSRCLQFNLKRLTPDQIRGQMEQILRSEGIEYEVNAVRSVARAADGSMRDGLSLLDQAIIHGGGRLRETEVSAMLGTVDRRPVFELLQALAHGDAAMLLEHIEKMAEHAVNFGDALQQVLILLHHAALAQWVSDMASREEDADLIVELARRVSAEELQLFYQIGLIGQRDLPLAPDPRMGFEMVMLRMLAFHPATESVHPVKAPLPGSPHEPPSVRTSSTSPSSIPQKVNPISAAPPAAPPPSSPPPKNSAVEVQRPTEPSEKTAAIRETSDWSSIIRAMGISGLTRELANQCVLKSVDEYHCTLILPPQNKTLRVARVESHLEKALQTYFGRPIKLLIKMEAADQETPSAQNLRHQEERQRSAEIEIEQDETVRALKERFAARVLPGSIKPLD
jgi:DNA polymerase-3 subunit gamma/tau